MNICHRDFFFNLPTGLGIDVWLQLDRRIGRPDRLSSAMTANTKLHIKISPTFLRVTRRHSKNGFCVLSRNLSELSSIAHKVRRVSLQRLLEVLSPQQTYSQLRARCAQTIM
jgi:hypothetical protein